MHQPCMLLALLSGLVLITPAFAQVAPEPGPLAAEAALKSFRVRPGFTVELVAAEPLVQDPIAFAWGPDGKFWVVEMGDYPLGLDGKGKPGGRVKFLEDADGDGKYDKATLFIDNIGFPTSVLPWRKGVLITCAPDILYAEDTDGDGKADRREILFTGFFPGNQQHRANTLAWGLDGWVYCANGDSGGRVTSSRRPKQPAVNLSGRDFRIRPDAGEIDPQTGQTQFGRCRDDWGNWFGGNNSNPLWHFALEDHYLRRNPHVAPPNPRVPVSVQPGVAPVYPISKTLARFNDWHTANRFTSACGPMIYRDELFGPAYSENTFVCEPVHNLVHREVMTQKGSTFTSRRAEDEATTEFLASSDNWFRPVFLQTGPDGSLWIADMYRHVIEHPQWIPQFWQQKLDLRAGHDRGRIYRVYPSDRRPRAIPRLDQLGTAGLVAAMDSPSGWQRDLAQMMLTWRADPAAALLLEKLWIRSERPQTRVQVLCALGCLAPTSGELAVVLRTALADQHPAVRRHAIRLCEAFTPLPGELAAALGKLAHDPDPQVRLQLACTLGNLHDTTSGSLLARLLLGEDRDPLLRAAIFSSVHRKNLPPFAASLGTALSSQESAPLPSSEVVEQVLRLCVLLDDRGSLAALLSHLAGRPPTEPLPLAALATLLDTLEAGNTTLANLAKTDPTLQAAVKETGRLLERARIAAASPNSSRAELLAALRLLGRDPDHREGDLKTLMKLVAPQVAPEVQAAAVAALGRLRDAAVPGLLLQDWKGHAPALRNQILDALLPREDGVAALLDAVGQNRVLLSEVDASRRQRLLTHRSAKVRTQASSLLTTSLNPDRQKVVDAYSAAIALRGDATRGKQIFIKHCTACHKFEGQGSEVGPDIGSVGDKSPEALLVALFDPNRSVEARYLNYVAETKNGRVFSGVVLNETGTSITLVGADGKQHQLLRTELEALASTGKSAMPDGLEKDLQLQDVADVIAYVRGGSAGLQGRVFKGNKPAVVKPESDRSLYLRASNAEIFGRTLVYEQQHGNLGWWTSAEDHAVWTVHIERPGRYAVHLDWACDDKTAGNSFQLEAGKHTFTARVEGTGGWDQYRQEKIGTMTLAEGLQRITLRPKGSLKGPLLDLKSLRLVWSGAN